MDNQEEIIRNVGKWGNSAGILLPKEWFGNQVKVVLINRGLEIKKEVMKILEGYLEEIIGIYLVGSYARGEQEKDSDIDILVVSKNLKKEIISGKYNISIVTLEGIKNTIEYNPELILPRLSEAKVVLNKSLLEELRSKKLAKYSFRNFLVDTKKIIKINMELIELDKLDGNDLISENVVYSLILRLRGLFLIKCLLKKENYSKKSFKKWLLNSVNEDEFGKLYGIYTSLRDRKKTRNFISIGTAEKLMNYLEKEIKFLEL